MLVTDSFFLSKGDTISISASSNTPLSRNTAGWANRVLIEEIPDFTDLGVVKNHEIIEDTTTMASYPGSANQYYDLISFTVPAGVFDFEIQTDWWSNGTTTTGNVGCAVSTYSGNDGTGLVVADNLRYKQMNNGSGQRTEISLAVRNIQVSSPTTYYLKTWVDTSTTNLEVAGKLTAIRRK